MKSPQPSQPVAISRGKRDATGAPKLTEIRHLDALQQQELAQMLAKGQRVRRPWGCLLTAALLANLAPLLDALQNVAPAAAQAAFAAVVGLVFVVGTRLLWQRRHPLRVARRLGLDPAQTKALLAAGRKEQSLALKMRGRATRKPLADHLEIEMKRITNQSA